MGALVPWTAMTRLRKEMAGNTGGAMGDWWVYAVAGMGIAFVMWVFGGP